MINEPSFGPTYLIDLQNLQSCLSLVASQKQKEQILPMVSYFVSKGFNGETYRTNIYELLYRIVVSCLKRDYNNRTHT